MWKRKLIFAALVTSSVGILPLPASADVGIFLDIAPPAPRYEVVPAPRAGFIWAPGYWDWRNNRHVWVRGHYERERRGYYWHPSRWEQRDGRYAFQRGGWSRDRWDDGRVARGSGDRDRDGVPNRVDRSPNNPYRQ